MLKSLLIEHRTARLKDFLFLRHYLKKSILLNYLLATTILLCSLSANAFESDFSAEKHLPPLQITGVVLDDKGNPLPGVTIQLKGKPTVGSTTDQNGRYIVVIPEADVQGAVLLFTTIGFEDQEIQVNGRTKIDVQLVESSMMLDETVVTAFGQKRKKEDVVGAITTITPSELKIPSSNLTTALSGRAAGVIAFQRSGEPGMDNAQFFIRGVTTFGYKVDPLIIIDNVEATTTELARLQVDDIENFSILKDATATAVYGSRGANGVLLISTKEGKKEKLDVSFRVENSISAPTKQVDVVNPVNYMRLANEALLGREPLALTPFKEKQIANTIPGNSSLEYPAVDWQEALLKKFTTNHHIYLLISFLVD